MFVKLISIELSILGILKNEKQLEKMTENRKKFIAKSSKTNFEREY